MLQLAGPWLAAAYARSTGPGSRLATWLEVDPDRTAFDGRLLVGDPVEAYERFARGAARFAEPHLSTLFPPVRPRGTYLEVRYLDAQPLDRVEQVVEVLATLAYDADVRARVLHELEPLAHRLGDYWRAAAAGVPRVPSGGRGMSILFVTDPLDGLLADIDATVGLMTAAPGRGCRRLGLRSRGPGASSRDGCGPGPPGACSRAHPRRRPPVADRVAVVRRGRDGRRRRGRDASRSRCCASTHRSTRATCTRPTSSTSRSPPGVRVVNDPAGVRAMHEKLRRAGAAGPLPGDRRRRVPAPDRGLRPASRTAVVKPVDGFAGIDVWLVDERTGAAGRSSSPPRRAVAGT